MPKAAREFLTVAAIVFGVLLVLCLIGTLLFGAPKLRFIFSANGFFLLSMASAGIAFGYALGPGETRSSGSLTRAGAESANSAPTDSSGSIAAFNEYVDAAARVLVEEDAETGAHWRLTLNDAKDRIQEMWVSDPERGNDVNYLIAVMVREGSHDAFKKPAGAFFLRAIRERAFCVVEEPGKAGVRIAFNYEALTFED